MKFKCEITEGAGKGRFMVSDPSQLFMGQTKSDGKKVPCALFNDWFKVERWLNEKKATKVEISIVG